MMPRYSPGMYWMEKPVMGTATTKTGKEYIFIEGDITFMAGDPENVPVVTVEKRSVDMFLSEKALPFTLKHLERLGFNGDFDRPACSQITQEGGLWVECKTDTYKDSDGKERVKDKFEMPYQGIQRTPANSDVIRKLNALWKQGTKPAAKPAAPKPPAAAPAPQAEPAEAKADGTPS